MFGEHLSVGRRSVAVFSPNRRGFQAAPRERKTGDELAFGARLRPVSAPALSRVPLRPK